MRQPEELYPGMNTRAIHDAQDRPCTNDGGSMMTADEFIDLANSVKSKYDPYLWSDVSNTVNEYPKLLEDRKHKLLLFQSMGDVFPEILDRMEYEEGTEVDYAVLGQFIASELDKYWWSLRNSRIKQIKKYS